MQPVPSRPSAAAAGRRHRRARAATVVATALPLRLLRAACAVAALAQLAEGAPQAEVRVRFSTPQMSYEHGLGPRAALVTPPLAALPPPPPPPQALVRRGRLVQFVLAPDDTQLTAIDLQEAPLTLPLAAPIDEPLTLPSPELLAHVLAGPLFFGAFPHATALLRYQRGREAAGLAADRLGSARPESPFYRWPNMRSRRRSTSSSRRRGGRARRRF